MFDLKYKELIMREKCEVKEYLKGSNESIEARVS